MCSFGCFEKDCRYRVLHYMYLEYNHINNNFQAFQLLVGQVPTRILVLAPILTVDTKLHPGSVGADRASAIDAFAKAENLLPITRHRSLKNQHVTTEA